MLGDREQEILQLMQVLYTGARRRRLPQSQSIGRKFEIEMTIPYLQDPLVTYEISKAAFLKDLRRQNDRLDLLKFRLFHHFNKLGGIRMLVGAPYIGDFPAHFYLGIINERVTEDLLYCNDFTLLSLDFVSVAEFSCVYHRVYF